MPDELIGILGGTFDPIHKGHLQLAEQLLQQTPITRIQMLPCKQPPHRPPPSASAPQRLKMLELAAVDYPNISVNDIEFRRDKPSYTIDTIKAMKKQSPTQRLCWIMGADAFSDFGSWHQANQILNYCHLIVVNRPGYKAHCGLTLTETSDPNSLLTSTHGLVLQTTIKPSEISATSVREQLRSLESRPDALPKAVYDYIQASGLYR